MEKPRGSFDLRAGRAGAFGMLVVRMIEGEPGSWRAVEVGGWSWGLMGKGVSRDSFSRSTAFNKHAPLGVDCVPRTVLESGNTKMKTGTRYGLFDLTVRSSCQPGPAASCCVGQNRQDYVV